MRGFRILLAVALVIGSGLVSRAESPATQPVRSAFLKIIDRPRVDSSGREQTDALGDFIQIKFSFASDASQRVPGMLLKQSGESRRPAVIVLHGTGGKKEGELALLKEFAAKGFVAVAIDGRYHGERGSPADYNAAIARAFENGNEHPFYWDTVWDVMRLIDYLQSRNDIDPKRIGLMGISKGGIETYFAAAVDDRIAVAAPCIGVQSFRWALEHDAWPARVGTIRKGFDASAKIAGVDQPDAAFVRRFYDRVVPGIYSDFDGPVMVSLIAPRPLLMVNGEKDSLTPLESVNLCADSARTAFRAAGVEEKFKQIVEPNTGHAVTTEARREVVAWFVRWLKP
jgi:dienelactone hydrolase